MALALFDLDNTLIGGDSDYLWGQFLVRKGVVDANYYAKMNEAFYQDYCNGQLDIHAYIAFSLKPIATMPIGEITALREEFLNTDIAAIWLPKAEQLVESHRSKGDKLVVITATNRFVVEPICYKIGITEILAIELEQLDGRYTGKSTGIITYQEGKVTRLKQWLQEQPEDMRGSYFYSDSINDKALLEIVDNPVAVDADEKLHALAQSKGWTQISLR